MQLCFLPSPCVATLMFSGYDNWHSRKLGERVRKQQLGDEQISTVFLKKKSTYGAPRICKELRQQYGVVCNIKTISHSLKKKWLMC